MEMEMIAASNRRDGDGKVPSARRRMTEQQLSSAAEELSSHIKTILM